MVQIPPTILVKDKSKRNTVAASYLEDIANQMAAQGWEFYRVDTIGVAENPGCLDSLFGANKRVFHYYVVTFRMEK